MIAKSKAAHERTSNAQGLPTQTGSRRIAWENLPATFRDALETHIGAEVVRAASQPGGFSEGLASLLTLNDGRRVFAKAANSIDAPAVASFHRREMAITAQLAAASAPRLLAAYDDGVWVAGVYAEIPGHLPAQPWRRSEFERVLTALHELSRELTPSPVEPSLLAPAPRLRGWRALVEEAGPTGLARLKAISPWSVEHLDELIALEEDSSGALLGESLLHGDLYPFNLMLTSDRVFAVDWPHAWIGAAHCDLVMLLASASLSGVDAEAVAAHHPLTRNLDSRSIDVVLAAQSGFLLRLAATVGEEADKNLVGMVTALGRAALDWLRSRL
jgi:hypothetical protein